MCVFFLNKKTTNWMWLIDWHTHGTRDPTFYSFPIYMAHKHSYEPRNILSNIKWQTEKVEIILVIFCSILTLPVTNKFPFIKSKKWIKPCISFTIDIGNFPTRIHLFSSTSKNVLLFVVLFCLHLLLPEYNCKLQFATVDMVNMFDKVDKQNYSSTYEVKNHFSTEYTWNGKLKPNKTTTKKPLNRKVTASLITTIIKLHVNYTSKGIFAYCTPLNLKLIVCYVSGRMTSTTNTKYCVYNGWKIEKFRTLENCFFLKNMKLTWTFVLFIEKIYIDTVSRFVAFHR